MHKVAISLIAVLFLLLIGVIPSEARIRHVPNDFDTIQEAIIAAQDEDTVLVQPETYVENISFLGKHITVGSLFLTTGDENFITSTIIDGDGIGKTVRFENEEGPEAILSGFTIQNGFSTWGGGIYCQGTSPTLDHLLITDNRASRYGGGVYATQAEEIPSDPTLINVTVAGNEAGIGHGGISTFQNSSATIVNSIFWDNVPFGMADGLTISYSDIERGYGGEAVIDQDPQFIDPDNGDFHISDRSPCIDTGDPNSPEDRDGSRADMGALFYNQGNVRIFNVPDEYETINEAIEVTEPGDTVLVHPGTYVENIDFIGKDITIASLYLITGDVDYIHQTIIDGNGDSSVVVIENNESQDAVLCGFTIRNGYADNGGGIFCSRANPTLTHLEIEDNTALYGGGIYLFESDATLSHVAIIQNRSNRDGSGISCYNSNPVITNCTISRNITNREGGGLYFDANCQAVLTSCIVWENDPVQIGGDGDLTITFSDIEDGWQGEGNINTDPLFADPDNGDFNLTWANWRDEDETKSPCIDTGDPDREPDPENTRADMGAYYWHQEPYRAIIVVDPQALNTQLLANETEELNFTVSNEGDTLLIYETEIEITLEPEGAPRRDRRGGPDDIEYEWRDDDEEDGLDYNWIDVSNREDVVEIPFQNDNINLGPFDLGFDFNFWGDTYNSIRVCSNGWASFTSTRSYPDYNNWDELPTIDAPPDFLAVAMSDWDPSRGGGEYFFWSDQEMAVITWENIPHVTGQGNWTFQVILYSDGMIKYQYAETGAPDGVQMVGVQNHDRDHGFEIIRSEDDYLVPGRTIGISRIWPQWLRVAPEAGEVGVNSSQQMIVTIDTEDLIEGQYGAEIHMLSNDQENPDVVVTVSLEVIGTPEIDIVWDQEIGYPDFVDWNAQFDNLLAGYDYDIDLDVYNYGTANLSIDSVSVDNEVFFVENDQFIIGPSGLSSMTVTFSADEGGEYSGNMTVYSSDPEQSEYVISLTGIAETLAPVIEVIWAEGAGYPDLVNWNLVYEELFATVGYYIPIIIRNTGNRDLEVIEISSGHEAFSADADQFILSPDSEREVILTFQTDEQGEFATAVTIRNNTSANPQYPVSVSANALNPPVISLEPASISDSLYIDWTTTHTINLTNNGEATLRFVIEEEILNEPERDAMSRTLRGANGNNGPRRDEPGDLIAEFVGPNQASIYCSPIGWDPDNEVMFISKYNASQVFVYTHDNYDNFEEVRVFSTPLPMDGGFYEGVLYICNLNVNSVLRRFDFEGNNLGDLQMGFATYGLAFDHLEGWMFARNQTAGGVIQVYEMDGNDRGEQIATLPNPTQYNGGNANLYNIEWVARHHDGQMWIANNSTQSLHQIAVDTDNWEYIDVVQSFNAGISQPYDACMHDGHHFWVGGWGAGNIRIYDDGIVERGWLSYEPVEGEVAGNDALDIIVTLDARMGDVGYYEANLIFRSNDPHNPDELFNIRLYISEPPSLVVEWDSDYGFPEEVNWNMAYLDLYNNQPYEIELDFINYNDDTTHVDSIEFTGGGAQHFSIDRQQFTIGPDEETTLTVTLEATESGVHRATMAIYSDAEEREEYAIILVGETHTPPSFAMEPEQLHDDLITGQIANHDLLLFNDGESVLRFVIDAEAISEPERDQNARTLRRTDGLESPRRDEAGDLIATINGINAVNNYTHAAGYDWDNEWMWFTSYTSSFVRAYS
ncbi:hypothetical protein HQ587_03960, partial [bacterium]|nr:hypothetical protein [bacterium]